MVLYDRNGPHLERLDNLVVASDSLSVDLRRRPEAGPAAKPLPAALFLTAVSSLSVSIPAFTLDSARSRSEGSFSARVTPGVRRPLSMTADVLTHGEAGPRRLKASLTADTDMLKGSSPTYMDALAHASLGDARARASFRLRRSPRDAVVGTGALEVFPSTGPLRSVRLAACTGSFSAASSFTSDIACRYSLALARPPHASFGELANVAGDVRLISRSADGRLSAALTADIDPVKAWYELSGEMQARLDGRAGRPLSAFSLSHDIRAALKIARFEDLTAFLRETPYAVPAPVHVLKGPLSLSLESSGDPRAARQRVRYILASDLAGTRQRLRARAAGELTVSRPWSPDRELEHAGDLVLKEVALELPRLEVGRAPKVTVDRRIRSDGEEPAPGFPIPIRRAGPTPAVRSRLTIRTEKPVILFSNLAKEPVPMALDLTATYPPAAVGGAVSIREFDVELFRRAATVDHIEVTLSSGSSPAALSGLVRYRTPSAAISIHILGTTERPRIELTSVPPMKREQIIALLIFGKRPDELDPAQTASVNNTETALQSRAFGLASLYLFGATPIEHVGYDSATKTTSVRLRLPGGANITLGSDFDQSRQLTVRKPLAPHWALQSEMSEQTQSGGQGQRRAAATFLEWFNRY